TVAENVTFIDVGIQLNVTPTVNEDGFVSMKIKPEVSSVASTLTTPSGNKIPILETSLAETTVMVRDGVSILIGGLRRDEKTEDRMCQSYSDYSSAVNVRPVDLSKVERSKVELRS